MAFVFVQYQNLLPFDHLFAGAHFKQSGTVLVDTHARHKVPKVEVVVTIGIGGIDATSAYLP